MAPGYNYPQSGTGYSAPGYNYPQSGTGYPAPGYNYPQSGTGYPAAGSTYSQTGSSLAPARPTQAFPSENMIPEFGQPLPPAQAPNYPPVNGQPNYGPGFVTQSRADSTAGVTPLTATPPSVSPLQGIQQSVSPLEAQLIRLEQLAFGSTYPEHELCDRVDHLESEVLGSTGSGDLSVRLAKVEAKLSGQGAFGQTAQAVAVSHIATSTPHWHAPPSPKTVQQQVAQPPAPQGKAPSGNAGTSSTSSTAGPAKRSKIARSKQSELKQAASIQPQVSPQDASTTAGGTHDQYDFQHVVDSIPCDKRSGDYFAQLHHGPNGTVARWTKFPVKVHLPQETPQSWQNSLEGGIKRWTQYLPLAITAVKEPADIEVVWVNHLQPNNLGVTKVQVKRGAMQCVVYVLRPTYYPLEVPEKALAGVFLHEIGHALGICGHSNSPDDLMAPIEVSMSVWKHDTGSKHLSGNIRTRDLNTLKHIYETPCVPQDFTSSQPTDWSIRLNSSAP